MFTMLFLIKYGKRPLHFFGVVGGLMTTVGFFVLVYLSVLRFSGQRIGDRPLLNFGTLFFLGGLQIFFTGFIADLIINISHKQTVHFPIKYSTDK